MTTAVQTRQVVGRFRLTREKGFFYFLDKDGDISRTRRAKGHCKRKYKHQKVIRTGVKRIPGWWYFIDGPGRVVQVRPRVGSV